MDNSVLHPKAKEKLESFAAAPSHALLLTGSEGTGKSFVAYALCRQVLGIDFEDIKKHSYVKVLTPIQSSLSIEAIRDLRHFLQLKTIGTGLLRRIALIEHADTLTTEAQNALLKILEEPPDDTLLILTANNPRSLLSTILSRTREIRLSPPESAQLVDFFAKNHAAERVKQAFFLSGGLPGLMHSLLEGQEDHPLAASVSKAKELLKQTQLERLAAVDGLSKQKGDATRLVEALLRISRAGLHLAAQKHDEASVKKWHRLYKLSLTSGDSISKNANTKLVLTNLMLQM